MRKGIPIFYSALLLTIVNLLLRAAGTSFQVYLSGRIGAAGIGLLQLTMSVGSLAMVAGMAGIRTATMYLTAEEMGRKRPQNVIWALSGCFAYSIVCSGSIAVLLYALAPWIAENWIGDIRTVESLRLFAGFLPTTCLCGVMTGYFTAANRIGTLAMVEVGEQLCSMGLTLTVLSLWAGNDPGRASQAVVLGSSAGGCITLFCLVILRLREHPSKGSPIPVNGRIRQAAVPLALADVLKSGINTLENLMVPKRLAMNSTTADPLAEFGKISGMVFPVLMFPACILYALAELMIPELARCAAAESRRRIRYLTGRSLKVAMLYGVFFGGMMYLLAQELSQALYRSPDPGKYLQLYAPLVPMLYCDAITDAMTKGLGQQKICVRYNIFTSALDVILLYLLLPKFGMEGYFCSFLITHLINFLLSIRLLMKITGKQIPLRIPLVCLGAAAGSVWAASHLTAPWLRAAAYPILLVCSLYLLKVIRKEDLLWLRGLIYKKQPTRGRW